MKLMTLKPTLLITMLTLTMATIGCSKADNKDSEIEQKVTDNTIAVNQSNSNSDSKQPHSQKQAQPQQPSQPHSQKQAQQQADHLVIVKSFKKPTLKQAKAIDKQFTQLQQQGFNPYFIKTDNYPPLKKGLWAMVLGGFDKATATAKQTQVKRWVADAYIHKIELPKLTPIGKEFAYYKTYLDDKKACFTFKEGEDEGGGFMEQYCAGIQGHRVATSYGDGYMSLFIDNKELDIYVGSNMIFVPENQPVAWIYRQDNPQHLLAMSMVIADLNEVDDITDDNKVNKVSKRYLFVLKNGQFLRVNKTFPLPVAGLDKVANYLSNGVKNSDLIYPTVEEEESEEIEEETTETDGIEDEATPYNQKTKYGITVTDCQFDLDKDNFCSDERMQILADVMAERQPNFDKDKILYIFKGVDDNIVSFPVEMYRVVVLDKKNKTARPLRYALGQATDIDNNPVQINDKGDTLEYQFDINSDKFCFIGNIYAYRDSYTYNAENYPKFCFINDEGLIKSF